MITYKIKKFLYRIKLCIQHIIYKYIIKLWNKKIVILDDIETVDFILKNNASVARFGDGEFMGIIGDENLANFQNKSDQLTTRLREVLVSDDDNMLICIPIALNSCKEYKFEAKTYWYMFKNKNYTQILNYLKEEKKYGNASLTRPYMDHKNKKKAYDKFKNIKKIWQNRDVVIVEGLNTKLGVGNDLFDNVISLKRILAPAKNAFDKYDDIVKEILKIEKTKLILIALGPTATILAYDLNKLGYQAIDIGHIDIEYEWMLRKIKSKEAIPGKSVNEAENDKSNQCNVADEKYEKSIIIKI